MPLESQRRILDASLIRRKHFPRPGETVWADSFDSDTTPVYLPIDLGSNGTFSPESFGGFISIMAAPNLGDGDTMLFTLQGSGNEQGPFEDLAPSISTSVTGAGGLGSPATELTFGLPVPPPRYLVVKMQTVGTSDPSADGWLEFGLRL